MRVIIGAAMILCVWFTISALRRKELNRRLLVTLTTSVSFGVLGAVIDYLRYALTESSIQGTGIFTRIGIFIFLMIFIVYIISDYSRSRIERSKAELMKHLAYTDALTGLDNRLSFNEREAELRAKKGNSCIIIQLDINNLKLVNDVYGHSDGDRHIRSAAAIIRKSFESQGICYRTGGDEFITVISPETDESVTKAAIKKMCELCAEYNEKENPPVPLQIAFGYAICKDTSTQLEPTELLADQRMYDCKREMKSAPA